MPDCKKYKWEHDSYDIAFRALDDNNSLNVSDLLSNWHASSASRDAAVARFLKLNKKAFDFLGITPLESDSFSTIRFKTSSYVGCVPLYSPVTGKVYANLIVNGRFEEEISEILPLLQDALDIEYHDSLILIHQSKVKPPIYYECIMYMEKYMVARRSHWRKFINERRVQQMPSSSTDWGKYAELSYSPNNTFRFPNKVNILTTNHTEWQQINYVLKFSIDEVNSAHTPRKTRLSYRASLNHMLSILTTQSVRPTTELRIHSADPVIIKELKTIGNRILESNGTEYHAWRIDFNKLFEQYVQYIFEKVAVTLRAKPYNNQKLSISGQKTNWTLSYLEPDLLLKKDEKLVIVDAKYKTHMLNRHSGNVETLHDSYRHDLHQVVAYSSFDPTSQKITMLVYPYTSFSCIKQVISTPLSSVREHVYLIGIPFGRLSERSDSSVKTVADGICEAAKGITEILKAEFETD